ncbi:MAG: VWA domain-containing protein [Phycisphaerales bacterium]|nr:MAG: VWA domain-containing protein [Phycisphaerales bacterium]
MIAPHALLSATGAPGVLGALVVGPLQLDEPGWLMVWPIAVGLALWLSRKSLAGLGGRVRVTAIAARVLLLTALVLVLTEPHLRDEGEDVSVTVVLDTSRSVPASLQQQASLYVERASETNRSVSDRLGVVTVAREPYVQALPSARTDRVERIFVGSPDGTDLAAGLRLALASRPSDAATRVVLATDGNETAGSLLEAAEAARAAGVPIDVMPLVREIGGEVVVERLVAPATARVGETIALKPVLTATRPTTGRLSVLVNGEAMQLGEDGSRSVPVTLNAGTNVESVQIVATRDGPQEYEAVFEPDDPEGDTILENNRALAVTFVAGEGRVLVLSDDPRESASLEDVLRVSGLNVDARLSSNAPTTLTELNRYDAVIMVNQESYPFSQRQQEAMRSYVHDSGGGLIMTGGDRSYGAGGWIGSPLEDALPVQLDPPQRRNMPRGALALIIHSVEMAQGVYFGKQTANAAVDALSRLDLVGIIEYQWTGGTSWVHPMSVVGDGSAVKRSINNLTFGDMKNFDPSFQLAVNGLGGVDAGQRHIIVITDGDPSGPSPAIVRALQQAQITVSIVVIASHGVMDQTRMQRLAAATNGRFYNIPAGQEATIPQIFVKEAQTVRRSLIWEGEPIAPIRTGAPSEALRGIGGVPSIGGYVVTAPREGLALVTLRSPVEDDPLAAQWQYGLGRVFALTTDAGGRWAAAWQNWEAYRAFWSQHVRWAMRPSGSADVRIVTETRGDETRLIVEAFTPEGERLPFADFQGRLSTPEGEGRDVTLRQVGPGRWETSVETRDAGSYLVALQYSAPGPEGGPPVRGSAQAAITRPFSDEFRSLEPNLALLRQVADATGGRLLPPDARQADLWRRDGLEMPVTTRAIWIPLALAALVLLLIDVAIRRVRLDPAVLVGLVRRAASPAKQKPGAQMDALGAARAKAKERIQKQRVAPPPEVGERAGPGPELQIGAGPKATSGEKPGVKPPAKPGDPPGEPEEGLGRLLKAKQRTRDDIDSTGGKQDH